VKGNKVLQRGGLSGKRAVVYELKEEEKTKVQWGGRAFNNTAPDGNSRNPA
jgi:hypothetical protein